jgi:argininosuccinate lyase
MPDTPKTPWGGRFSKPLDAFITEFGASLPVDRRMWREDVRGSVAHVRMLGATGIIPAEDAATIERGLREVEADLEAGEFAFSNADEDIHMAVERALREKVGAVAGKLHTARSRNDQVALDTRLWTKAAALRLAAGASALRRTLLRLAEHHAEVILPGYTHLQRAQPVLLSHHLLAYVWMLSRDVTRIRRAYESADRLPLGAAALAGTPFPIDREMVARELGFSAVTANSLDTVSDRDFALDMVYACNTAMIHLSRLCEELVLWNSGEFGFVTMDDAFSTGSSIMPQKKNPDVAELVRGKSGRVVGDLTSLLVTLKGLPLAYNKDMQEDKEPLFDAVDTLEACLRAVEGMVGSLRINSQAMAKAAEGGFMAATDLADHLVGQGVPFREAHEVVGRLVASCEASGRTLQQLAAEDLAAADARFGADALDAVAIATVVARRDSSGGTGHEAVKAQLAAVRELLEADDAWLEAAAS